MSTSSINIQFTSTNSFVQGPIKQQQSFLDSTNQNYLRYSVFTNNGLKLVHGFDTVFIPIGQLYGAAAANNPNLTWPPIITQPPVDTNWTMSNHTGSFNVTASSETSMSYQWQIEGTGSASFVYYGDTVVYTGSATPTLYISQSNGLSGTQYRVVVSNGSGQTTSSVATLTLT